MNNHPKENMWKPFIFDKRVGTNALQVVYNLYESKPSFWDWLIPMTKILRKLSDACTVSLFSHPSQPCSLPSAKFPSLHGHIHLHLLLAVQVTTVSWQSVLINWDFTILRKLSVISVLIPLNSIDIYQNTKETQKTFHVTNTNRVNRSLNKNKLMHAVTVTFNFVKKVKLCRYYVRS